MRRTVNGVVHQKKCIWDTGATAAACGIILARQWGLVQSPSGGRSASTGAFPHRTLRTQGANGKNIMKQNIGIFLSESRRAGGYIQLQ